MHYKSTTPQGGLYFHYLNLPYIEIKLRYICKHTQEFNNECQINLYFSLTKQLSPQSR